jgi:hypothetical protein
MKKEIDELDDELRPEYDFARMQGGVKGKYIQRYRLTQEEEPILQAGATYEVWSPLDSHEAARRLAQLLDYQRWDEQLEQDIADGKLEDLAAEAIAEFKAGQCRDI